MFGDTDGDPNTAAVGSVPKGASQWGIQDMVGNVGEWVADWYADYDASSASTKLTNPKGPDKGGQKIMRGGAWNGAEPSWVRPSFRFHVDPKSGPTASASAARSRFRKPKRNEYETGNWFSA